jgi:hypothetical protein
MIGRPISQWLDDREEERVRRAFEDEAGRAAMASVSDLPAARLISIRADRPGSACGWIELTPEIGAVPFSASGPSFDGDDILVSVPRVDVTDPLAWIHEIFTKQLITRLCDRPYARDEQLPTPANAHRDPRVDGPVLALWEDEDSDWAVIPARSFGYVGVRRQVGGGATVSPIFPDRAAAELWTRTNGAALAQRLDAQGAERMRLFEACLDSYEPDDIARRVCFTPAAPAATS